MNYEKKMNYERYRLVLYHEMIIDDKNISLDEPIVTEYVVNKSYGTISIVINEMFERLKNYMLKCLTKENNEK